MAHELDQLRTGRGVEMLEVKLTDFEVLKLEKGDKVLIRPVREYPFQVLEKIDKLVQKEAKEMGIAMMLVDKSFEVSVLRGGVNE